jgi:FADH2 O2-dependent halogenase
MAAYLAKAGAKCTVFESELFPRPHVGESFVPSSTRVFKDLDFLPTMEALKFPRKYGAGWTASHSVQVYGHDWEQMPAEYGQNGKAPDPTQEIHPETEAVIRFEEREMAGVDQNYTYHVDRGIFDNALLHHAHNLGATVHEGVRVSGVDFDGDALPRVRFAVGGHETSATARIVVDATGRRTLLGNQLKLRIRDNVFDQFAIHTWFRGYDRVTWTKNALQPNYIFVHFLPLSNSWVWQIPITDDITSIGVVTQRKNFPKDQASREDFFWQCVSSRPEVYERLKAAEQVHPFREEGDYSYAMKQITGDGWVMVGDAGRFVDPIFSTGVSIALNSSRLAQRDILKALETGNTRRDAFSTYEHTIKLGTNNWYKFISVYYRLNVLFTWFITDERYRLDVLKLLQGDVYEEEEPPVLEEMRKMVRAVEGNPDHPWHRLLNDMTAEAFRPLF